MDRYQLAPVRDARARDERLRRGDLAAAVTDARALEDTLAVARGRTAEARRLLAATRVAGPSAATLVLAERYVVRRRRDLQAAIDEEIRAEVASSSAHDAIDIARHTLVRARADREVIERHFTRWREARKRLVERRED